MPLSFLVLATILIFAAIIVVIRQLTPDRPYLFQGMFRYEADLGWPRGVQEEDGERAWVPKVAPAWDPEADELAWAAIVGTSTLVDLDGDRPPERVPIERVRGVVSTAPRRRDP